MSTGEACSFVDFRNVYFSAVKGRKMNVSHVPPWDKEHACRPLPVAGGCANNCRPQMGLFCTIETFFVPTTSSVPHCTTNGFFQDGICVVWVCFVPFRTVFVWCGFVLYHLYCFQVYSYTTGTTQYLFHNQNGSKIVLCANNCRPQMELFCTIETFFVPQSDSIPHFMFQGSHTSQEGLKQVSTSSHIGRGIRKIWASGRSAAGSRNLA